VRGQEGEACGEEGLEGVLLAEGDEAEGDLLEGGGGLGEGARGGLVSLGLEVVLGLAEEHLVALAGQLAVAEGLLEEALLEVLAPHVAVLVDGEELVDGVLGVGPQRRLGRVEHEAPHARPARPAPEALLVGDGVV
jgi:hypothetical protein